MASPNILLVTIDSLRYDFLYEEDKIADDYPNLQEFAHESDEFHNAFANAPFTSDSFPAILGGTHPNRFQNVKGLEPGRPYLPALLQDAGYSTLASHSNPNLSEEFGYADGFDEFYDAKRDSDLSSIGRLREHFTRNISNDSLVFKAAQKTHGFVSSHLGQEIGGMPYTDGFELVSDTIPKIPKKEPVFIWIQFMDVHSPFYPHSDTVSSNIDESTAISTFNKVRNNPGTATESDIELLETLYRGEIQYLDSIFGELLSKVEKLLNGELVVLFTSDHGEAFGEHDRFFHENGVWNENLHIPFIVRGDQNLTNDIETPVSNADILPTLLSYANLTVPAITDGEPVQDLSNKDRQCVIAHSRDEAMAATAEYKLIRNLTTDETLLFDRQIDPSETTDVSADHPEIVSELDNQIEEYLTDVQENELETEFTERNVSDDTKDRLEALGYR